MNPDLEYIVEQVKAVLAIDSPTGYTKHAADYVLGEYRRLGYQPRLTGKGAFKDVYSVMANWGANHGVTVYGHVGADLVTLASMLRIPVALHNLPEDKIYRPHAWAAFGTQDTEAADFAACKHYGPLYR